SIGAGARAIGMGGAYTAVADDVYAPYWNPAGIVQTPHFGFTFGAGYQGNLEKLSNVEDAISNEQMPNQEDMNQSYLLNAYIGFTTRYFALSSYGDFQLKTIMDDTKNIAAGTNLTGEGYGVATIAFVANEYLAIGINFKKVVAAYGEVSLPPFPTDASKFSTYQATVSYNTGTGTAFDLGTLVRLTPDLTMGLVAHNVFSQINSEAGTTNTYSLDYSDSNNLKLTDNPTSSPFSHSIELPKTYDLGLAYRPFETTTLAADIESINNTSDDQIRIHLGMEQTALWDVIALRLGCFTNKGASMGYTAGLGFQLWALGTNLAYVKDEEGQTYLGTCDIYF
ncbi:MAG TPA: hypothetical protein DDW50_15010, partial [Firmicutes bacterium]|nr:hypothetical protein [Bacillota bacterium]